MVLAHLLGHIPPTLETVGTMSSSFSRRMVALYLQRLVQRTRHDTPAADLIFNWFVDNGAFVDIDIHIPAEDSDADEEKSRALFRAKKGVRVRRRRHGVLPKTWRALEAELGARIHDYRSVVTGQWEDNLVALSGALGLDEVEQSIFDFAVRIYSEDPFEDLCDDLIRKRYISSNALTALCLGYTETQVVEALRGPHLIPCGLIDPSNNSDYFGYTYRPGYEVHHALLPPHEGLSAIEAALLGPCLRAGLLWNDFEHLGRQRDLARDLLAGAARTGARGVNILLYGAPGTGKTEFAKALAAQAGFEVHAVGESSSGNTEPDRSERLQALMLGQQLARFRQDKAFLFDEMEDFVYPSGYGRRTGSKVFVNRLFEHNPAPVIWATNDVSSVDPAYLRRMSLIVEMKVPPISVRTKILTRLATKEGLALSGDEITRMARQHAASPGVMATALRSAHLARGSADDVELVVQGLARVVDGKRSAPRRDEPAAFVAELVNGDQDMVALADRLAAPGMPSDFSLCLYGAPGTGKTAYVRYIAEAMGLEVMHRRASDLISPWVGESEANIARAFADAAEAGQFLVIDEADSLLFDRRGATRSWEVSQVNEMLTWMESHPAPFACTTNLMEQLDHASLRRFTFKVKFDYLTADQVGLAFRHFFGEDAPSGFGAEVQLAPGDFAVVARKLRYRLGSVTPAEIAAELRAEMEARPGYKAPFGFAQRVNK